MAEFRDFAYPAVRCGGPDEAVKFVAEAAGAKPGGVGGCLQTDDGGFVWVADAHGQGGQTGAGESS